jgi:hypothetical protein
MRLRCEGLSVSHASPPTAGEFPSAAFVVPFCRVCFPAFVFLRRTRRARLLAIAFIPFVVIVSFIPLQA